MRYNTNYMKEMSVRNEGKGNGEGMDKKSQVIYGGRQMRDARLKAGIGSQKELADRTGIAPNIISDLERGQRLMSPNWAKLIGEAIGAYSI